MNGKRFGIISLGNIGSEVAKIAEASGRNIQQPYFHLNLDKLLITSVIVSIHAPLNKYTANLINYERFLLMKKSAILINTGRGGIVNESDLARVLDEDLIAGAGIDVFEEEPLDAENPLLKVKQKEKLVFDSAHSLGK